VFFDSGSQDRYVDASNALVLARREEKRKMLARTRKKPKLTQQQTTRLTGGGHNAFSRYERGEAHPMPAVVNLLRAVLIEMLTLSVCEVAPLVQARGEIVSML
jgi:HTH-type transcriptional regulator/antitoxin MqsA